MTILKAIWRWLRAYRIELPPQPLPGMVVCDSCSLSRYRHLTMPHDMLQAHVQAHYRRGGRGKVRLTGALTREDKKTQEKLANPLDSPSGPDAS